MVPPCPLNIPLNTHTHTMTTNNNTQSAIAKAQTKTKSSKRGGAARGASYLAGRLLRDVLEDDEALIGCVCKVVGNHRISVCFPDPSMLSSGAPLHKVPLITAEAAAVEANVRKLLYNKSNPVRIGSKVLLAKSGKTYEVRTLFSNEFTDLLEQAGRIHPRLNPEQSVDADCGIEFDYEGAAEALKQTVTALKGHKNKTLARGLEENTLVPSLPVKAVVVETNTDPEEVDIDINAI